MITRETIVGDLLDRDETLARIFADMGMHCLGCPAARAESVEEACEVHGIDCGELLERLNRAAPPA